MHSLPKQAGRTNIWRRFIAVVLVGWADYARIVRGVVLATREQPYIEADYADLPTLIEDVQWFLESRRWGQPTQIA